MHGFLQSRDYQENLADFLKDARGAELPAPENLDNTLLDLRETWANTTQEERKDLVHVMLQEVGVEVAARRILWIKVRSDYEPLFAILDGLHKDGDLRYWIKPLEAQAHTGDIEACTRQMSAGVKTFPQMSDKTSTCLANALTSTQEYIK